MALTAPSENMFNLMILIFNNNLHNFCTQVFIKCKLSTLLKSKLNIWFLNINKICHESGQQLQSELLSPFDYYFINMMVWQFGRCVKLLCMQKYALLQYYLSKPFKTFLHSFIYLPARLHKTDYAKGIRNFMRSSQGKRKNLSITFSL